MSDRARTILVIVLAALAVAATVAGFSLAEGDGGDEEGAAALTYCATGEPLGLSAGSADVIVFVRPRASTTAAEQEGRLLEADTAVRQADYVDQAAQDVQLLATPPPVAGAAAPGAQVLDAARRVADHARTECDITASVLLPA